MLLQQLLELMPSGWSKPLPECPQKVQPLSVSNTTQIHPEQEATLEVVISGIQPGSLPALFQNDSEPPERTLEYVGFLKPKT